MSVAEKIKKTQQGLGIEILDSNGNFWPEKVDCLRKDLGSPYDPTLFPPHFLKSTFPKIGGKIIILRRDSEDLGAVFLFPRNKGVDRFTARVHISEKGKYLLNREDINEVLTQADVSFELYDPSSEHLFGETHSIYGVFDIGRPSEEEVQEIRSVQKKIWGADDDFLYPADMHSDCFNLATSLVIREKGQIIGFLFGFYKFEQSLLPDSLQERYRSDLRVESQLMGFLPEYRRKGLGFELKRRQAVRALEETIDIVNWTVDPLQFPNAVLNFGKLRAIAFDFFPDYYSFRNELNQVAASRFGVTWFVNSPRSRDILFQSKAPSSIVLDLRDLRKVARVNDGFRKVNLQVKDAKWLAIEVPSNWTVLQRENIEETVRWRDATDEIFGHYLGPKKKGYAIVDVGIDKSNRETRCYLLAKRIEDIYGL